MKGEESMGLCSKEKIGLSFKNSKTKQDYTVEGGGACEPEHDTLRQQQEWKGL